MKQGSSFTKTIEDTKGLLKGLKPLKSAKAKISFLKQHPHSKSFFTSFSTLEVLFSKLTAEEQEILYTLTALGQGDAVFSDWNHFSDPLPHLKALASSLKPFKKHYQTIGGIAGYQLNMLILLDHYANAKKIGVRTSEECYREPDGVHLEKDHEKSTLLVKAGILSLPEYAEVYPVGGAADRLNLYDDSGKTPLPQARLQFQGVSLLEGMIQDLIARERLYYRLTGKRTLTPIALMTSPEKQNRQHIEAILEENYWFWRPKELFFLFDQPMVPMLSDTGRFATKSPLALTLKPGGHGILWQLMKTNRVFSWLNSLGRDKILVRQINNPLAGTDTNLLAMAGKGALENKSFGFLSCPRLIGAAEGMNVIIDKVENKKLTSTLTNIEYTEFTGKGLKDEAKEPGSPYSPFPANTNILFAKIPALKKALKKAPLPGLLINLKNQVTFFDSKGKRVHSKGGRLETTMQNVADAMGSLSKNGPVNSTDLETFVLFNNRKKTLSVTKKKWIKGEQVSETPEGAFCDRQENWHQLFTKNLNYLLPVFNGHESPSFIIDVHPALGPLWNIIKQKIQKGLLSEGSDLTLHIEKLYLKNLSLDGALQIKSNSLKGTAYLKNVVVKNRGINREVENCYWKGAYSHKEKLEIILHGNGEFIAKDVTLEGPLTFEVPDGYKMILTSDKGKLKTSLEKVLSPSWYWAYKFGREGSVLLTFINQNGTLSD